jgi:hypothetical protein
MKSVTFERALHRWDKWLKSIAYGRRVLSRGEQHPSLEDMRSLASKVLAELGFPPCTILELYWLCCVLTDYRIAGSETSFRFGRLVLPDWFPFPFGFKNEEGFDFRGKRIYPPEVWSDDDRIFWAKRDQIIQVINTPVAGCRGVYPSGNRRLSEIGKQGDYFIPNDFPDTDWVIVLSSAHPVHTLVSNGRPSKLSQDGTTFVKQE